MYRAKDIMTKAVTTVTSEQSVEETIRILVENKISGAPVVDEHGKLLGIISEYQLLEVLYRQELKAATVRELMRQQVLTVTEDASLTDIADLFVVQRIRRVPVLRNGHVVGVVSRRDVLRAIIEADDVPTSDGSNYRTPRELGGQFSPNTAASISANSQ